MAAYPTSHETLLEAASRLEPSEFMTFFKNSSPEDFVAYEAVLKDHGGFDEFSANPLREILMGDPLADDLSGRVYSKAEGYICGRVFSKPPVQTQAF